MPQSIARCNGWLTTDGAPLGHCSVKCYDSIFPESKVRPVRIFLLVLGMYGVNRGKPLRLSAVVCVRVRVRVYVVCVSVSV